MVHEEESNLKREARIQFFHKVSRIRVSNSQQSRTLTLLHDPDDLSRTDLQSKPGNKRQILKKNLRAHVRFRFVLSTIPANAITGIYFKDHERIDVHISLNPPTISLNSLHGAAGVQGCRDRVHVRLHPRRCPAHQNVGSARCRQHPSSPDTPLHRLLARHHLKHILQVRTRGSETGAVVTHLMHADVKLTVNDTRNLAVPLQMFDGCPELHGLLRPRVVPAAGALLRLRGPFGRVHDVSVALDPLDLEPRTHPTDPGALRLPAQRLDHRLQEGEETGALHPVHSEYLLHKIHEVHGLSAHCVPQNKKLHVPAFFVSCIRLPSSALSFLLEKHTTQNLTWVSP